MSIAKPAWTPGSMYFHLDAPAEDYVLSHSTGYTASGAALSAETGALGEPSVMMLAREQYAFMRFLSAFGRCRRALDIGTFTGLSAQALAEGMGRDGKVVTIERDSAWLEIARRHWTAAGVIDRIEVHVGEAIDILGEMSGTGKFDIVFLDADKENISAYFERSLDLLSEDGIILVDNALWHGWVMDETRTDADTQGMQQFNEKVVHDARIETVLLPIADGLMMIRRSR